MLIVGAVIFCVVVGFVGYGWLFARRPHPQRLMLSIALALAMPLLLVALVALIVGYTFMAGGG